LKRKEEEERKKQEAKAKRLSGRQPAPVMRQSKSPSPRYKADQNDPLDMMLAEYLGTLGGLDENIQREKQGQYLFSGVKVLLRNVNGTLVARIGGGWIKLDEYLARHDQANTRIYHMENSPNGKTHSSNTIGRNSTTPGGRLNRNSAPSPQETSKTVLVRSFSAEQIHQLSL